MFYYFENNILNYSVYLPTIQRSKIFSNPSIFVFFFFFWTAPKPTPPITGAPTPDPGAQCKCKIVTIHLFSSILIRFFFKKAYLSCRQCVSYDLTQPRECDWCANPNVLGDGVCVEKVNYGNKIDLIFVNFQFFRRRYSQPLAVLNRTLIVFHINHLVQQHRQRHHQLQKLIWCFLKSF